MSLSPSPLSSSPLLSGEGIACVEKSSIRNLVFFGTVFTLMCVAFMLIAVPEELSKGSYVIPVTTGIGFIIGGLFLIYACRAYLIYQKIGKVLLYLDPVAPGTGGDFGVSFELKSDRFEVFNALPPILSGTLTCIRSHVSSANENSTAKRKTLWQKTSAMHISRIDGGYLANYLVGIPEDCEPTQPWSGFNSVTWEFRVDGDLSKQRLGKFNRVWPVNVNSTVSHSGLSKQLPANFIVQSESDNEKASHRSAFDQVDITETDKVLNIVTDPRANRRSGIVFMLISMAVVLAGLFTILHEWLGGYIVMLVGFAMMFFALVSIGGSVESRFYKESRQLYCVYKLFGVIFKKKTFEVHDGDQFELKVVSHNNSKGTASEFYAVNINDSLKSHTVIMGINGRGAAEVLRNKLANY